jgi:predicted Zn-dependent protease
MAAVAAILVYVFTSQPSAPPPQAAGSTAAPAGGMPDLSTMTPREQFLRLHDRVMTAAEQGDTATFNQFAPMSLMAYQNLPEADADVRYHAATLRLHTGDIPGAKALADTLAAGQKDHLFAYMLWAAIARFENNSAAATEAYRGYLAALDAELKAGRPEYAEHQTMIDNFTQTARAGVNAR